MAVLYATDFKNILNSESEGLFILNVLADFVKIQLNIDSKFDLFFILDGGYILTNNLGKPLQKIQPSLPWIFRSYKVPLDLLARMIRK